jgi:hypothetical protein
VGEKNIDFAGRCGRPRNWQLPQWDAGAGCDGQAIVGMIKQSLTVAP